MTPQEGGPRSGASGTAQDGVFTSSLPLFAPASTPAACPNAAPHDEAAAGQARKLAAMVAHAVHNGERILAAQRVACGLLIARPTGISADDLRDALGEMPDTNPRWIGAVFHALRVARVVRRADYILTRRAVAHRRPLSLWVERVPGTAASWLKTHGDAGS